MKVRNISKINQGGCNINLPFYILYAVISLVVILIVVLVAMLVKGNN